VYVVFFLIIFKFYIF